MQEELMNVFVSWRGADRDLKNEIVTALKTELSDIAKIWESDTECTSQSIAECADAISRCHVFVAVITDAAFDDDSYLHSEITLGHEKAMRCECNLIVYKDTDRPYNGFLSMHLCKIFDANRVARITGSGNGIATLCDRVRRLLELRRAGTPEKPYTVYEPKLSGVPVGECEFFVEGSRDTEIQKIESAFLHSNAVFVTHTNGYGKRSAVRHYVNKNRHLYKDCVVLNLFEGSLRALFSRGINFENVNPEAFDSDKEDENIAKRAELLSKLGSDTLIIVPNVTVDPKTDGGFITDLLSNLGCRMLIITESLPKPLSLTFPEVDCGRMAPEHLEELFYNWCPVEEYDRTEELSLGLRKFFDKIGGHTYAVELTARALADEIGLYPEDIPSRLSAVLSGEKDSEEDSITALISGLYDTAGFTDEQQDFLCCAALVAETPMDERTFLEFLAPFEVTPRELAVLCEGGRWLRRDVASRTVSIEPLLGAIVLGKLCREDMLSLANYALQFCDAKQTASAMDMETQHSYSFATTITRILKKIGAEPLYELSALSEIALVGGEINPEEFERTAARCRDFLENLPEELVGFEEVFSSISTGCESLARLVVSLSSLSRRGEGIDINAAVASNLLPKQALDAFIEGLSELEDSPLNRELTDYITAVSEGDAGRAVSGYLRIAGLIENERARPDKLQFFLIEQFGSAIVQIFSQNAYTSLSLAKASIAILERSGQKPSPYSLFLSHAILLSSLCRTRRGGEAEAKRAFETTVKLYPAATKSFVAQLNVCHTLLWETASAYINILVDGERLNEALEAYKRLRSADKEAKGAKSCPGMVIDVIYRLAKGIIDSARLEEAEAFISRELTESPVFSAEASEDARAKAKLSELQEAAEAIRASRTKDAEAEIGEYLDYYKTYGGSHDRSLTAKYSAIADAVRETELSSLTRGELLLRVEEAKRLARSGIPLARWAPLTLALIDEAGMRTLGYRYHRVQLIGAMGIYEGHIAEIQNGEGKTYTIAAAAFLSFVAGRSVHVLDGSEYLTERNYQWMRGALEYLGVRVGVAINSRRDLPRDKDVTYAHITAAVMHYLRDENSSNKRQPMLDTAIADEADSLMVLEAGQAYVVSDGASGSSKAEIFSAAYEAAESIPEYERDEYFEINENGKILMKEAVYLHFEQVYGRKLSELTEEQSTLVDTALLRALQAHYLWQEGKEYHFVNGRVLRESLTNGALTPMDRISTYMLARREGVLDEYPELLLDEGLPKNYITGYEYLKKYRRVSGTSATASALRAEFKKYYGAQVMSVPPNSPIIRIDRSPLLFADAEQKLLYLLELVRVKHEAGQPVMVICGEIAPAREISARLKELGINHSLISGKTALLSEKQEAEVLGLAGKLSAVTVCTAVANRGVDILLGGNPKRQARDNLLKSGISEELANEAIYGSPEASPEVLEARSTYRRLEDYYTALAEGERRAVTELGGLCVIGTECFPYLSTEQQVRGRCGRQSAPGESYMLFSLDDESFAKLLGGTYHPVIKKIFLSMGVDYVDVSSVGIVNLSRTIRKARERYQSAEFRRLDEGLPESLYQRGKDTFFGEKNRLLEGDGALYGLIERVLEGSAELARGLKSFPEIPLFNRALDKRITELRAKGVKKRGELIAKAFRAQLEDPVTSMPSLDYMCSEMRKRLCSLFKSYMKTVNLEYAQYEGVTADKKKQQKHMEEVARLTVQRLLEGAVFALLSQRYLPAGRYAFKKEDGREVSFRASRQIYAPSIIKAARDKGVAAASAASTLVENGWELQDALDYTNKVYKGEIV